MGFYMDESLYTIIALGVTFVVSVLMMVLTSMELSATSNKSLPYFEENDPNIKISGLSSLTFSDYGPLSYNPYMGGLGYTGKVTLDCYTGTCSYYVEDTCYYEVCEDDDDDYDYDDDDWDWDYDDDDWDYDDWHTLNLLGKNETDLKKKEEAKKAYKESHMIKDLKVKRKANSTRTCKNKLKNFFHKFNPYKSKTKRKIKIKRHPKSQTKLQEKNAQNNQENTKENKNLRKLETCWEESYDCSYYVYDVVFACSEDCHRKGSCSSCPYEYDSIYGECALYTNTKYTDSRSCYANNMVQYWKGKYYTGYNISSYHDYLTNAYPAEESCPSGMKQCGILDSHGNKLCLYNSQICPINYIQVAREKPESPYTLSQYEFSSDLSFWYTNQAVDTGKVVEGLFVDSDLKKIYLDESHRKEGVEYNTEFGCEVLDNEPISQLLYDNEHLYQNVLTFNPYSMATIDSYGAAYLSWCVPGHGRITDLNVIRELKIEYDYNVTVNNEIIQPIKSHATSIFFCYLFAFIYYFILLILIIITKNGSNKQCEDLFNGNSLSSNFMHIVCFMAPTLILNLVVFILALVTNGNLDDLSEKTEVGSVDYLNALNHFIIWGSVALFAVSILSAVLSCFIAGNFSLSSGYSSKDVEANNYPYSSY